MGWEEELSDKGREEWEGFVRYQREVVVGAMVESAFVAQMVPSKEKVDVKFAVELGMSIMLDKPILAIVMPGIDVPRKLRRVADVIVFADPDTDAGREKIRAAAAQMVDAVRQDT